MLKTDFTLCLDMHQVNPSTFPPFQNCLGCFWQVTVVHEFWNQFGRQYAKPHWIFTDNALDLINLEKLTYYYSIFYNFWSTARIFPGTLSFCLLSWMAFFFYYYSFDFFTGYGQYNGIPLVFACLFPAALLSSVSPEQFV